MSKETKELAPIDHARNFLGDADGQLKKQLALALPKHMTPDRMLRIALTAAIGSPNLQKCFTTPAGKLSIARSLLSASQMGLEPDGINGHIVPFGGTAQFIPDYKGLIQLAYNHPKVKSIWFSVVYEKDFFVYEKGLNRTLQHKDTDEDDPGPLKYVYAVCEMEGGAKTFVCMNRREVMQHKKASAAAGSGKSPWTTHEPAMWCKTAVKVLFKQIPQSNELRLGLERDDEVERIALSDDARFAAAKPVSGSTLNPFSDAGTGETNGSTQETQNPDEKTEAASVLAPVRQETATGTTTAGRNDVVASVEQKATGEALLAQREASPQSETVAVNEETQATEKAVALETEKVTPVKTEVLPPGSDIEKLAGLCVKAGITEEQLLAWSRAKFKFQDALKSLVELGEVAPKKTGLILSNFASWEAEIKTHKV